MAHLSLALLGPFQATLDGQPITTFESSKVRALLAYLAVEAARPHPREMLAGFLWPDWPERSALANLRYALSNLREALGDRQAQPPFLLITREAIQFNRESDYDLDVQSLPSDLTGLGDLSGLGAIERLEKAVALYRGPFLEGFSLDSSAYEEWLTLQREHLAQQMLEALRRLATYHEECGEYERAQRYARRQVELAPLDEEAQRQLMRALALGGQRSAALAQYESCRRVLSQELDVEPARETAALYESIRQGTLVAPTRVEPCRGVLHTPIPGATAQPMPAMAEEELPEREHPPFVARERELAWLNASLDTALGGQGRVAFVVGEPGSGKTLLASEFARQAMEAHADLIVASGNCNAYTGVGDPYLPFLEVLGLLTGDFEARLAGGAIGWEHARRLQALLPAAAQALVSVGPDLINLLVPGEALLARARAWTPAAASWRARLEELAQRRVVPGNLSQTALFEQCTRVLQALARAHPLLLILDDLQWADSGSINLLFHLGRKLPGSRILVLGAYRPEEMALGREGERHPLEPVLSEFRRTWGEITLDMAQAEGRALVEALVDREPNRLGAAFRETLHRHTGGHALFTVEVLRDLQARGDLRRDEDGRWVEGPDLDWERLPARVEAVIGEGIGRLPEEDRALLAVASVEGEEFTAEAVACVRGTDGREVTQRLSGALSKQHRLVTPVSLERLGEQRLSRYRFRHYLFQHYLYQGLDEVERARLHEELGEALEALYGGRPYENPTEYMWTLYRSATIEAPRDRDMLPATAAVAPQLARHFRAAGLTTRAALYLVWAARRASLLCAYAQVRAYLTTGVQWLQAEPDTPERAKQEFVFQLWLVTVLTFHRTWGAPEATRAAERAFELARQIGDPSMTVLALQHLAWMYQASAKLQAAERLLEDALECAQRGAQASLRTVRFLLGFSLSLRGQFTRACQQWDDTLALYRAPQGPSRDQLRRSSPDLLAFIAWYVWVLGYPDRATRISRDALSLATNWFDRPRFMMLVALLDAGLIFHHVRREVQATLACAQELLALNREVQLAAYGPPTAVYRGWALAQSGQVEEGIASMRQGIADFQAAGSQTRVPHFLALLAEGYLAAARPEEGLAAIAEALERVERTDERYYEAEIHRIQGELLRLRGDDPEKVEESYRRAIVVAQGQEAKSWELRAAMSLARLLRDQGRRDEARETLAAIYGWFTEGFDTPDLVEAKALLDELES